MVGESRLTTTRVAERAGVSVGTLYQYFPHKRALLYAVLHRHLDKVAQAVETACCASLGSTVADMAEVLVGAFLDAKAERLDVTQALYLVAEDLDTRSLIVGALERNVAATASLLETAMDASFADLPATAAMAFSAIAGSTRILFERGNASASEISNLRRNLTLMCRSYLEAARRPSPETEQGGEENDRSREAVGR